MKNISITNEFLLKFNDILDCSKNIILSTKGLKIVNKINWHFFNLEYKKYIYIKKLKTSIPDRPKMVFLFKQFIPFIFKLFQVNIFQKILLIDNGTEMLNIKFSKMHIFKNFFKNFTFKWIPGMLTNRVGIFRNFQHKSIRKKQNIIKKDLIYYQKSYIGLLSLLPDLVFFNTGSGTNYIASCECHSLKIPTIVVLNSFDNCENYNFKFIDITENYEQFLQYIKLIVHLITVTIKNNLEETFFKIVKYDNLKIKRVTSSEDEKLKNAKFKVEMRENMNSRFTADEIKKMRKKLFINNFFSF